MRCVKPKNRVRAKKTGKEGFPLSRQKRMERLLEGDQLLARHVCSRIRTTSWVKADHTRFIRAERALTSRSHRDRNGRGFERGIRAGCSTATARTSRRQSVTALDAGNGDDRVQNASRCRRGGARKRTTEIGNRSREALSPRGGVGNFRGYDGADRTYGGRFIGRDAGAKQVRNCDGRDDQNDCHDDQQFDKRKTLLILLHCFGISLTHGFRGGRGGLPAEQYRRGGKQQPTFHTGTLGLLLNYISISPSDAIRYGYSLGEKRRARSCGQRRGIRKMTNFGFWK